MDKRGFSLMELLAVIVILGIIASITVLAVNNVSRDVTEENRKQKLEAIEIAAYKFGSDNKNDVAANPANYYCLSIDVLIEQGYLSEEAKEDSVKINEETGESIELKWTIVYDRTENKIKVSSCEGETSKTISINVRNGSTTFH